MNPSVQIIIDEEVRKEVEYIWEVFSYYIGIKPVFVNNNPVILISNTDDSDIQISNKFIHSLKTKSYDHHSWFLKNPLIYSENGVPDYLGTCFYMLNSLQEYNPENTDKIGRLRYIDSFQYKFNCIEENLVAKYFDELYNSIPVLNNNITKKTFKTKLFFSHDIDKVYGSFIQDGFYALKKGRIDIILQLIFNEIIRKPGWLNMDKIMDIEDEHNIKSTFFWLVNKGNISKKLMNSDYDFHSKTIQQQISNINKRGFTNGLHKSVSNETYEQEIEKSGFKPLSNRNHLLKFPLPKSYENSENAGIKLDCSLGFPETIGFRNCFGQPFKPFNLKTKKTFDLIETPLNIMDATFYNHLKIHPRKAQQSVFDFLDKHKENCIISILWHNKYFTNYKYKGFLDVYKGSWIL